MKTNEQKLKRVWESGKGPTSEKRMWITRRQINIAKREQEQTLFYWKNNGAEKKPTHVSFAAGGTPEGQWVYGEAKYNGLTAEEGDKTLKARRRKSHDKKMKGRISIEEWQRMATV